MACRAGKAFPGQKKKSPVKRGFFSQSTPVN
jgi:hypothetical protein